MAYNAGLAQRVSEVLGARPDLVEKRMFGGVGYMLQGNMACGVNQDDLIIRLGPDRYEAALAAPYTAPFDMTGRPMKGWIVVRPEGYASEGDLKAWVDQGVTFALSLAPK